ncbi:MAG: glycosyltransferase family 2 protein [Anaerolineae bacterium]|nr:glycosyltransferase family 2 protein [Anaerolineae bacterium]
MTERPFASVIIPNYNGERFLPTCLDALRAQDYPADRFEVIVVDDASRDGSLALLERVYPEVRVVALSRNRGLAAACNAGAAVARGDALVMLNNDTEAEPGWLAALMDVLATHPEVGAVASKMLLFDRRDVLHSAGDMYGRDGIPRNRGVWERDEGQYDADHRVFGGCGGAVAYRRTAWNEAGGFDEQLFMYLEDVDLAWRLRLLGWEAWFAPEARVYHHLSATGGGVLASYYTGRNTLWVLMRDVPGPILRRHWPVMLRAQLRIAWDALRAWRGEAARARLRGQIAGLLGAPRMLAQRGGLQARRRVPVRSLEELLV